MASLRDQFEHFYGPDEDAEKTAIQTGLVTPDTKGTPGIVEDDHRTELERYLLNLAVENPREFIRLELDSRTAARVSLASLSDENRSALDRYMLEVW